MPPALKEYGYQLFIALDQGLNVVNAIFYPFQGPGHCENAYIKEVLGRHLSQRFYEDAIRMNIAFDAAHLGTDIRMPG